TVPARGGQAAGGGRDAWSQGIELAGGIIRRRPVAAAAVIAAAGMFAGLGLGAAEISRLQSQVASHDSAVEDTRRQAQREVNALAARVAELEAAANRVNALGERLTQLGDQIGRASCR